MTVDTNMIMLMLTVNAPFYAMSFHNYQMLVRLGEHCPECIRQAKKSGDENYG